MLIVVLTRVLTPPAPLLLLLVVLTRVLAPLAPLLMLIFVLTCVFAPLAPLLLLLVVLTHVLAQLGGLCVHCVVVQCCKIAPNSSLQDWLAFAVDKSPVVAKKISGENDVSSWCPFSVSQVIGYENVRWVSHKILY